MSGAAALPPLALTMGEPAGIGGEITLKAWTARDDRTPPFLVIDDPERLRDLARALGLEAPVRPIERPEEAASVFPHALPVLPQPLAAPAAAGAPDPVNAGAVIASIDRAVALARAGRVRAVVTNPIHKRSLYEGGFEHPGHTEYLAALAGGAVPVMMLAAPGLRVVPVTVHVPLREVPGTLTRERIVACGRIAAAALASDFGIAEPRLAVAALNPHAGESGSLGREEIETIGPAVADLRAAGIDASGPSPADSLFHEQARARYDAVLCMYHDQALIPLKTIDWRGGVNVTLGLPFVRTSPDHGAGLDIAGTGRADPASLRAAIALADEIARRRHGRG